METAGSTSKCNELLDEISKILDQIESYENSEDMDSAETVLEQLTTIFPDILLKYGLLLSGRSKLDKAIEIFRKAVLLKPTSIAFNNLACCLAKNGDNHNAIDNFKSALKDDPDNIDTMVNLAGLYYNTERFDEAIKLYEEALTILPRDTESLLMLSNCYFKKCAYESAIIGYQNVLKLDPGNEDAKSNLKTCLSINR